jgi:two-component system chemotaxis response regulator CheB
MKRAGAIVIAQSPATAQYASMPIAAARAGADLVLPIDEIGRVLADIVKGAPLPETGEPTTPPAPTSREQSMDRAPNNAATRAEMAWQRAAELRRRRQELSEGFGATEQTVSIARRRAQESLRRAQLAHQAASEASARRGH